jgi:hypothetical protein
MNLVYLCLKMPETYFYSTAIDAHTCFAHVNILINSLSHEFDLGSLYAGLYTFTDLADLAMHMTLCFLLT